MEVRNEPRELVNIFLDAQAVTKWDFTLSSQWRKTLTDNNGQRL